MEGLDRVMFAALWVVLVVVGAEAVWLIREGLKKGES